MFWGFPRSGAVAPNLLKSRWFARRRTPRERTMLDIPLIRVAVRLAPGRLPGGTLHRHALAAVAAGRDVDAEQMFEAAAASYRRELCIEPLARLRVHQLMARARATGDPVREAEMMLEIVRKLNKLDRLESLQAPFELRDAREVLTDWLAGAPILAPVDVRDELAPAA